MDRGEWVGANGDSPVQRQGEWVGANGHSPVQRQGEWVGGEDGDDGNVALVVRIGNGFPTAFILCWQASGWRFDFAHRPTSSLTARLLRSLPDFIAPHQPEADHSTAYLKHSDPDKIP